MKTVVKYIFYIVGLLLFQSIILPQAIFAFQRNNTTQQVVEINLTSSKKNSVFSAKQPVRFKIVLKNNVNRDQEGTLVYKVNNKDGETVLTNSLDVKVNGRKKIESSFEVPLDIEGDYTLSATIELSEYSEQIDRNFSYSGPPRKANDRRKIPNPYDQSWTRDNFDGGEPSKKEALVVESKTEVEPEETEEEEGEIITKIKPAQVKGVFPDGKNVRYAVYLVNKYKSKQEGTFTAIVTNDEGELIGEKKVNIKLGRKGAKKFTITLPEVKDPGIYNITAALNLTTYDDTTRHAFGYKLNSIKTPYHYPKDFDEFWKETMNQLDLVDPNYRVTYDEGQSTYFHNVYKVEMQSLDNVTCFGWLSIPKPKGKYPVLLGLGGYKIELNPLYFDDFICFTLNVRGIDKKVKEALNPTGREQFLVNIEDKNQYIYRGIYMDCVRAVQFLFSHADMGMNLKKVVVFGGSQGASMALVTAALVPDKINAVVANNPIFFDWPTNYKIGKLAPEINFPVRDIMDFEAKNPSITTDVMFNTLQYFEVQNFVPRINCPTLFAVSLLDPFVPPSSAIAAFNKMKPTVIGKSDLYIFPDLGHEVPRSHDAFASKWFIEKLVKNRKNE